jgi:hypothetical protein
VLGHAALPFGRTAQRIYDTRELDKKAIAGGLDDAAFVLGNLGGIIEFNTLAVARIAR